MSKSVLCDTPLHIARRPGEMEESPIATIRNPHRTMRSALHEVRVKKCPARPCRAAQRRGARVILLCRLPRAMLRTGCPSIKYRCLIMGIQQFLTQHKSRMDHLHGNLKARRLSYVLPPQILIFSFYVQAGQNTRNREPPLAEM